MTKLTKSRGFDIIALPTNLKEKLIWYGRTYRGKNLPLASLTEVGIYLYPDGELIYAEHDDRYLKECLLNLRSKGAELVNGKTIDEMLLELDLKGV